MSTRLASRRGANNVWRQGAAAVHSRRFLSAVSPYLQTTKIPTYHFQNSLPRLPIPDIEKTAQRYIKSATPLVSESELVSTKKAMDEFVKGVGSKLHNDIVEREKKRYSSFITDAWFDMYLCNRDPLPININPQLTFHDDPIPGKNKQTVRAALLAHATAKFMRTLDDGHLQPDMFHTQKCMGGTGTGFLAVLNGKGGSDLFNTLCSLTPKEYSFYMSYIFGTYPLDMSQYGNLFHSTRIPRKDKDELEKFAPTKHMVVQRGSAFWAIDILRDNGSVVPPGEILEALEQVMKAPVSIDTPPVGVLTTMNRDKWAAARAELVKVGDNEAKMKMIDSALFALTLEDHQPEGWIDQQNTMLHGAGRNRWFDKSFHYIVLPNGRAALNFEHSWGDGVAVLRLFNEVFDYSAAMSTPNATSGKAAAPVKINLEVPSAVAATCKQAAQDFDQITHSLQTSILEVPGFTSSYIKSKGLGLDGVLQMSFQLAHYQLHGHSASTYESANQSAYKHGRTETVRSCTPESDAMCKTLVNRSASAAEKVEALQRAVDYHGTITRQALMGAGWDRHMFALKYEAQKNGLKLPAIYEDVSYKRLSEIILSTSTLSSPTINGGGFGPVGDRCYGIGYTTGTLRGVVDPKIRDLDGFACSVMAFKKHRDAGAFTDTLKSSLELLRTVIDSIPSRKSKE